MVPVTHFNLEITNLCNQRCSYCFNNSGPFATKHELSTEIWRQFLDQQTKIGLKSVHITGGEPFVNAKALELMAAAQQLGLSTSVLSNGYRVPQLIEKFRVQFQKLSVAQISLDLARAVSHDVRRGKVGAWRQAVTAVRSLWRADIPCEISCTVSQENLGDVKRLARFCRRFAFKLIVRPLVTSGRAKNASLEHVQATSLRETLAEIERQNPGTVISDKFSYVPDSASFDAKAREEGIVTVLPDGNFRAGRVFFPQLNRNCGSVSEILAVA